MWFLLLLFAEHVTRAKASQQEMPNLWGSAFLLFMAFVLPVEAECPRLQSKIVRRVIQQELLPLYNDLGVGMPRSCPWSSGRDVYNYQEELKYMETTSKWVCQLCGKAFYEERFLDAHLDSRHPQSRLKSDGTVCLADYCEAFRCSVHEKRPSPGDWEVALCQDHKLEKQRVKCLELLSLCIPKDVTPSKQKALYAGLNSSLCSYLSCDNYWTLYTDEASSLSSVVYILVFLILLFILVFYYTIVSHQLNKSEESIQEMEEDSHVNTGAESNNLGVRHPFRRHSDLRQRQLGGLR